MLLVKLQNVLAKVISAYHTVDQCILLLKAVSMILADGRDFDKLLTLDEFETVAKKDSQVKRIVISFVDGESDENARFPKTLDVATDHFKYFFIYLWHEASNKISLAGMY